VQGGKFGVNSFPNGFCPQKAEARCLTPGIFKKEATMIIIVVVVVEPP
jgi:hypothetical protein